jgi:hypothetical protein
MHITAKRPFHYFFGFDAGFLGFAAALVAFPLQAIE